MKTKKLLLSAFIFGTLTVNQNLFASHIVGSMITYEYVSPNQYLLTFKYYRDCFGIPAPSTVAICYSSASLNLDGTVTLMPIPGTGMEIFPVNCFVNSLSSCQGGPGPGIQEWIYNGMVTLPQPASDWIFSFEQCCRSTWITTLNNAAGIGQYVHANLDNLNFPVNSSPQYSLPFAQYCVNVLSTYSLSYTEADGDSLVFSMVPAQDAPGSCPMTPYNAVYNPSFSATNPITSSLPTVFDPVTGSFTFAPSVQQVGVIDMLIQEYRNGFLIGETQSDNMIFIVANGINNPNHIKGKIFTDANSNGVYDSGEQGMQGTIVEVQPGGYLNSSNIYGDYSVAVTQGSFIATVPNPPLYFTMVPASHAVTFTGTFQVDSINDFALTPVANVQDLRIELTGSNAVPGEATEMYLACENVGTMTMSASASLIYDSDLVYATSTPGPDIISGDTLTWLFNNFAPLDGEYIEINFLLPSSVPVGTLLNSSAQILPVIGDTFPQDNYDTIDCEVVASCDPNEKKVEPSGPITTTQVANGQFLEYTIFFQNTGTAPAINIYIDDTLDQNFNIPTFEVLSASHNYTWNITGPGIVKFTFNNIMLPDSGTNQLLSHGFIKYRIKPKSNLIAGDKMINTAYIVFDSNAPLATNSTSTTVINPVTVGELSTDVSDLIIYPNPANNFLNIEMNLKEATSLNVHLYNLLGESLLQTEYPATTGLFTKQVSISDLSNGIYFLKIATSKGMSVVKIVKN